MLATWSLLIGVLLILMGLSDTWRRQLPVSASALYLVAGYLLGPEGFRFLRLNLTADADLIEVLTEAAVLVSLFAVGLRLRVRLSDRLWVAPLLMATVAMVLTIATMVGVGLALGLSLGAALLLAAVLAPTDPVLASDVQVENINDRDRLRFSLTGEGGLNDGAAFPFVMLSLGLLGLHELGPNGLRWWGVDVLWATLGGLCVGWVLGFGFSKAVVYLRREREQALGMESFFTLGLIALTYGAALTLMTYGFLAVFAAGLAMRHVEYRDRLARVTADDEQAADAPDEDAPEGEDPGKSCAYMAKTVLDFTLDLEKLVELTVMLVVGSLLSVRAFTPTSVLVALALIFVARPVAIFITTARLDLSRTQRAMAAWFGIRGIGSMYYLAYAVAHGADTAETHVVADAVLVTIALSVLLHGSSATPVMEFYRRARGRGSAGR